MENVARQKCVEPTLLKMPSTTQEVPQHGVPHSAILTVSRPSSKGHGVPCDQGMQRQKSRGDGGDFASAIHGWTPWPNGPFCRFLVVCPATRVTKIPPKTSQEDSKKINITNNHHISLNLPYMHMVVHGCSMLQWVSISVNPVSW